MLFLLAPFKRTSIFIVPLPAILVAVLVASIELAGAAYAGGDDRKRLSDCRLGNWAGSMLLGRRQEGH